ncbi:hypothetical protein E2C01_098688 [Portunus trituberculatus]|uniref:Uncharacterized protein n=1 Tax=Portunus trituberculatus TaxID=210409 RepID=A0A5B7K7K7_PORTR|nr:hypothetical protein [Portunus trituberculatus]
MKERRARRNTEGGRGEGGGGGGGGEGGGGGGGRNKGPRNSIEQTGTREGGSERTNIASSNFIIDLHCLPFRVLGSKILTSKNFGGALSDSGRGKTVLPHWTLMQGLTLITWRSEGE